MAGKAVLVLLAAVCLGPAAAQIYSECFAYFQRDHITYDMRSLQGRNPDTVKTVVVIDGIVTEGLVVYDFCKPLPLAGKCATNFQNSHAYFKTEDGMVCVNLMSSHSSQNNYRFLDDASPEAKLTGFRVFRKKPEFDFQFVCDRNVKGDPAVDVRNNQFVVRTVAACGELNSKAQLLQRHRILISIFMFAFGFVVALFGYFKVVFLRHFVVASIAGFWLYNVITDFIYAPTTYHTNFLLLVAGVLFGLLFLRLKIRNESFSGALLGFSVGAILAHQALLLLAIKASDVS